MSATLVDVLVLPLSPTVINGHTQQMQAIGVYDDDTETDVTTTATWSSGSPAKATVGASTGLVTGVATGTSVIAATFGGRSGAQTVTSGIGSVISVAVTGTASKVKGQTSQMVATATYQDTSTADVSASATWASSNHAAATVSGTGLVTAVEVGTSNITATSGGVTSPVDVFTCHNNLVSIAVTPSSPSKALGLTQQFTATGTFEDSSAADITPSSVWTSATPAHVTIGVSTGLATAVGAGTSVITATKSGISGTATETVTAKALVSVAVTPASPTVINGSHQQMVATGTYTDASTADVTSSATWNSATPSHATVSVGGLVTGVADGTSVVGATVSAIEGHTTTTSTKGNVVSIAVSPVNTSVLQGLTQQMVCLATYQDGSTADLASIASWTSSATAIATISATGLVSAVAGGPSALTTITATVGSLSNSTPFRVAPLIHNFYSEVDCQNASSWTPVAFGFLADSMMLANVSGVEIQISMDGVNNNAGKLDATTDASGHSATKYYGQMQRTGLWLKRTTGTGGGAKIVRVEAAAIVA